MNYIIVAGLIQYLSERIPIIWLDFYKKINLLNIFLASLLIRIVY